MIHHEGVDRSKRQAAARPKVAEQGPRARPRRPRRPARGRRRRRRAPHAAPRRCDRGQPRAPRPPGHRARPASDDGMHVDHRHVGDPVDDALARLADPLVQELDQRRPGPHPDLRQRPDAAGCSTTPRAPAADAGATWRPVATGRSRPAIARAARSARGRRPRPRSESERLSSAGASSIGRTSVARRVIDSSSCGEGNPAMRWR